MAEPGQAQTSSLGKARTPSLVERIMARGNVVRVNGGQKTERPVSSNYSPPAPASTVGSAGWVARRRRRASLSRSLPSTSFHSSNGRCVVTITLDRSYAGLITSNSLCADLARHRFLTLPHKRSRRQPKFNHVEVAPVASVDPGLLLWRTPQRF